MSPRAYLEKVAERMAEGKPPICPECLADDGEEQPLSIMAWENDYVDTRGEVTIFCPHCDVQITMRMAIDVDGETHSSNYQTGDGQ